MMKWTRTGGALAALAANRVAVTVWRRVFDEDPPE